LGLFAFVGADVGIHEFAGVGEVLEQLGTPAPHAAAWLSVPYATARAAVANRRRLGSAVEYVRRRGSLAFSKGSLR